MLEQTTSSIRSAHLLCMQLGPKLRADTLQCVTFATPPVVTRDVAIACEDYVTTVVHQVNAPFCNHPHCLHSVMTLAGKQSRARPGGGTR